MNINPKTPIQYVCIVCDYKTLSKSDFTKHTKTIKHLSINNQSPNLQQKQTQLYTCMCGKLYNDNSGLWRHKKKCNKIYQDVIEPTTNIELNQTNNLPTSEVNQYNSSTPIELLCKLKQLIQNTHPDYHLYREMIAIMLINEDIKQQTKDIKHQNEILQRMLS